MRRLLSGRSSETGSTTASFRQPKQWFLGLDVCVDIMGTWSNSESLEQVCVFKTYIKTICDY